MSQFDTPFENTLALEKAIGTNDRAVRQGGLGESDLSVQITKNACVASRTTNGITSQPKST
jgi:hypothetical protein